MASVNSVAVGEGRRSVGEFTYRYVNGVTIATKRIFKNGSNTPAQQKQRQSFAEIQALKKELRPIINAGYIKSGKLTASNYFSKVNTYYSAYLREYGDFETHDTPILHLYNALEDPRFVNRKVFTAYGGKTIESETAWDKDNLPVITIYSPYEFIPGDTITIAFALTYEYTRIRHEKTRLFTKTLTAADIDKLPVRTTFVANNQTMPGLNPLADTHADAIDIKVVATAILHTTNVTADTGNATSLFINMPPVTPTYAAAEHTYISGGKMEIRFPSPEAFPTTLVRNAIGATLRFPALTGNQSYLVTALIENQSAQPIGFTIEDKIGHEYALEPLGSPSSPCPLTKDSQLIAHITNLLTPNFIL